MPRILKPGLWLIPVCLIALSACSSKPCPPARPILPPVVYLQDVPEPALAGSTVGDLTKFAADLRDALRLANRDKAELRAWLSGAIGPRPHN